MKTYLIAGALGLILAVGVFKAGYNYGALNERDKVQQAVAEFRAEEYIVVQQVETVKKEIEVVYRDRIKVVREVVDSCADRRLPDALLNSLRNDHLPPG